MHDDEVRPASKEDLKKIIASLNQEGAPYLLIGGYALATYGYTRNTEDIDILVPTDVSSVAKILKALLVMPRQSVKDVSIDWFLPAHMLDPEDELAETAIRVADEYVVDILFRACGETYETLQAHAVTIDFEGIPVRTIDLAGLRKTKLSGRAKDAMDLIVLDRALQELQRPKP